MEKIELLSPAGNFECLKAAIQNGADAVYFGADKFNARQNGINFNKEELKKAIEYAKLRNVKTHLTLNILIQNNEFAEALELVEYVYSLGIDAIIVQDLGLAKKIIELFPNLEVHASTQMTTYNLNGVKELEKLGVNRAVLARELSLEEIKNICKDSNIDIEIFVHGALCICYSGQCLMSSIIGGRSGNRGKCAGTCRLPYTLINDNRKLENGYLLSSKDVCTLDILPEILKSGVKSLKIEGRMKSPEYVGLVTSIYRKYIDLANSNEPYKVLPEDKEKLLQIFNRGGFSTGYLKGKLGKDMMYIKKPNHIGIEIGKVTGYNSNKGYVKIELSKSVNLGDSIAIGNSSCKISELMKKNTNIKTGNIKDIVTIGRIYGDIKTGQRVYKTVDINLNKEIDNITNKENRKRELVGEIILKQNEKILFKITDKQSNLCVSFKSDFVVQEAEKVGLTKERIIEQLSKTGNTVFEFSNIEVIMDNNIIAPISILNELRRNVLAELEKKLIESFKRNNIKEYKLENLDSKIILEKPEVNLFLANINENINYTKIKNINNIYIPFKFFIDKNYEETIKLICENFNVYIAFPSITKGKYEELILEKIDKILELNNIKGVVISNISQLEFLKNKKLDLIANYTMNVANDYTIKELKEIGFTKYTILPELNKNAIKELSNNIKKEAIVYGRTLLMTSEYCVIGTFKNCIGSCTNGKYTIKDRLGFEFPVYTDRINCNNSIYNSKITSIKWKELNIDSLRIDILEETEKEINNIINNCIMNEKIEGKNYTNGNLNKTDW